MPTTSATLFTFATLFAFPAATSDDCMPSQSVRMGLSCSCTHHAGAGPASCTMPHYPLPLPAPTPPEGAEAHGVRAACA